MVSLLIWRPANKKTVSLLIWCPAKKRFRHWSRPAEKKINIKRKRTWNSNKIKIKKNIILISLPSANPPYKIKIKVSLGNETKTKTIRTKKKLKPWNAAGNEEGTVFLFFRFRGGFLHDISKVLINTFGFFFVLNETSTNVSFFLFFRFRVFQRY